MECLKYTIFYLLTIFFTCPVFGQNPDTARKITLVRSCYRCDGCDRRKPPLTQTDIEHLIAGEPTLSRAAERISNFFSSDGDRFILFCAACDKPKTLGYMAGPHVAPGARDNGFATYVNIRSGATHKGTLAFYKFSELLNYLTDSVLVFDNLELSTAVMIGANRAVFRSLKASYQWHGTPVERAIPYDSVKQVFRLGYNTLFSEGASREETDAAEITLSYQRGEQTIVVPGKMKVFFASKEEQQDMVQLYRLYKETFPDWTMDQIADELTVKIAAKYKNASKDNFVRWLERVK